mmetsp:Transcript_13907/g.38209  ORF Transcript_13907/g.38209 Transcript_13907/m.38209 type:complete len:81 (-) Transcript_13907:1410-1652(-)
MPHDTPMSDLLSYLCLPYRYTDALLDSGRMRDGKNPPSGTMSNSASRGEPRARTRRRRALHLKRSDTSILHIKRIGNMQS